jgi:hypothetical protein
MISPAEEPLELSGAEVPRDYGAVSVEQDDWHVLDGFAKTPPDAFGSSQDVSSSRRVAHGALIARGTRSLTSREGRSVRLEIVRRPIPRYSSRAPHF